MQPSRMAARSQSDNPRNKGPSIALHLGASMPMFPTRFFGHMSYEDDSIVHFPLGIPGFEEEREFVLIHQPARDPVMFFQSVLQQDLCFVTLPVHSIEPAFALKLSQEELSRLGLSPECAPTIGEDVLCVALVSTQPEESPYVNLFAPIVVNLTNRLALQVIQSNSGYSCRHPIETSERQACL